MTLDIIKLSAIASTNTYVKEIIKQELVKPNTVVWTDNQTHGRGQHGNPWYAEPNSSLACSIYRDFSQHPDCWAFMPSMLVALSVKKVLDALEIPGVSIKWPNDIMSYNKKIGGILIENIWTHGKPTHRIIGVGLNVNNLELPELPQASSLRIITGKLFNIEQMVHDLATSIVAFYNAFKVVDQQQYYEQYLAVLFKKDTVSTFTSLDGKQFQAIIKGVTPNGLLELELEDESRQCFDLKTLKMHY